jgi:hypothetical protein
MKNPADPARETDIDRLLGKKALFNMRELKPLGGPSSPTLYRARRAGIIETVQNGGRTTLTRATVKRILLEGLGSIPWRKEDAA